MGFLEKEKNSKDDADIGDDTAVNSVVISSASERSAGSGEENDDDAN